MIDDPNAFRVTPGGLDQEDDGEDINGALSALPGVGKVYNSLLAARVQRQKQNTDEATKAWAAYKDAIASERVGPTKLERIASALTAFGRPTTHGNFFEALGNANQSMLETAAQAKNADIERRKRMAELAFQQSKMLSAAKEAGAGNVEELQLATLKEAAKNNPGAPKTKDQLYATLASKMARGEALTPGEKSVWEALNPEKSSEIVAGIQSKLARGVPLTKGEREILASKDPAWKHRAPKAGAKSSASAAATAAAAMGIKITGGI